MDVLVKVASSGMRITSAHKNTREFWRWLCICWRGVPRKCRHPAESDLEVYRRVLL